MFFELNKQQNLEKKIEELTIRQEALNREVSKLLKELEIRPEQLTTFVSKKDNFTEENWQQLQEAKSKLDEKLSRDLNSIRNPKETEKTYKERHVDQHWLFVR